MFMEDTQFDYERGFSLFPFSLCVHFYLCTRVGDCGNVYPYSVTDDRVGRNKKRKDNGKNFSDEIVLGNLVIMRPFCVIHVQRRLLNKHLPFSSCSTFFVHPVPSFEEVSTVFLPY